MKSEFRLAFNEITERFGLPREVVMEALEAALVSAYRRSVNASSAQNVEARFNPETGEFQVYAEKEVVESVENLLTEVALEDARQVDPEAQLGGMVMVVSTPRDFGRVAAQTAKQVILQRLREAERDAQYLEFIEREGDLVHGTVHSITPQAVTVGLGRAEALLPRNQQIPGEGFRTRDRIRVYVLEVRKSSRGPVIVVSRTHPNMLRRLLEMEVPEINQGLVEIRAIAREAGKRAKVAVSALREGIDPVGACVGLRGVRIQSIVRDLNDEKIDVIEWNPEPAAFIAKALSPARVSGVYLDEDPERGKTAMVVVPEDQLSLAIGRAGVNARLAARLTGWRVDIKSLPEAAAESLRRLTSDPAYADLAEREANAMQQVEAILLKKAENRPVTPEEYQVLTTFVERVEREVRVRQGAARQARAEKLAEVRAGIPVGAFQTALAEVGLSDRLLTILGEAGYVIAGQVLEKMGMEPDAILGLDGIGPKSMEEIQEVLRAFAYPEPVVEAPPEVIEEAAPEAAEAAVPEPAAVAEAVPEEAAPAEAGAEAAKVEAEGAEMPTEAAVPAEGAVGAEAVPLPVTFEVGTVVEADEEEEEAEASVAAGKKRKKGQKGARVVEFDEKLGEMVVKRRRKPGRAGELGDIEEFEE
ncbi:MAG TPA: transcription termination factor NusA [Anaerolineales bacterium]|nr:transcription termination factor NusA [Anaerolineales bacterium]